MQKNKNNKHAMERTEVRYGGMFNQRRRTCASQPEESKSFECRNEMIFMNYCPRFGRKEEIHGK